MSQSSGESLREQFYKVKILWNKDKILFLAFAFLFIPLSILMIIIGSYLVAWIIFGYNVPQEIMLEHQDLSMRIMMGLFLPMMVGIFLLQIKKGPRKTTLYNQREESIIPQHESHKNFVQDDKQDIKNHNIHHSFVFSDEQKRSIINALRSQNAILPCPRCGENRFEILNGYLMNSLESCSYNDSNKETSIIPSICIVCSNCGYINQHAIGKLGLLIIQEAQYE